MSLRGVVFASLLLTVTSGAVAQQATTQMVQVVRTSAILEEPRGDAGALGAVASGQVLEVLDDRGGWYLVRSLDDGTSWRTGWINQGTVALIEGSPPPLGSSSPGDDDDKLGVIDVDSQPAAAAVFVEGFFVGQAPVRVDGLPPGNYRVVIKSAGHSDFVQDVTIVEGAAASVAGMLLPDERKWSSPVRAEGDWATVTDDDQKRLEDAEATKPLGDYEVLEISNFLVKSADEVPADHLLALFGDLARGLEDRNRLDDWVFATNYTKGPSDRWINQPDPSAPTLVLSGVITEYQRGSQTTRYLVGFGAGRTRIYCLFRVVDKATGEVLLERMENGSVSVGLMGGDSSGAMKELGEDIAKALERNW